MRALRQALLFRDIAESLQSNPLRAGLAFAALALGMSVLTLVLGVIGGLHLRSQAMVEELGVSVFGVGAAKTEGRGASALTPTDVTVLRNSLGAATVSALSLHPGGPAVGLPAGTQLAGTDEQLFHVRPWTILDGRAIDTEDVRLRRHVVVVSRSLQQECNLRVGDLLRIGRRPYTVIGIADLGGIPAADTTSLPSSFLGQRAALIPLTVPPHWRKQPPPRSTRVDTIFVKTGDKRSLDAAQRSAVSLLAGLGRPASSLTWITADRLVGKLAQWQRVVFLAGGAAALLCLVLGGTTLASLLLANIRERIPEIGLRRAIGASSRDIGLLFLCEATILAAASATAGSGAMWLVLRFNLVPFPIPVMTSFSIVLVPALSGLVLGACFALWPARIASRIQPSEALRNA